MHVLAVLIDALDFVSGVSDLLLVVAFESASGRKSDGHAQDCGLD